MKFTQKLVEKYGDSVTHYFVCAWLTSMLTPFGWWGLLVGVILSVSISYIKEKWLDVVFEKNDLYGGILGSLTSVAAYLLIVLIKSLCS